MNKNHSSDSSSVQSPGGSSSHSPGGSVGHELTLEQRQIQEKLPRVQRMNSYSKRLTNDLAISLLAGKEEVIRTALKRVSSDASDASEIKFQLRKKQDKLRPLEEYIASLNTATLPAGDWPATGQLTYSSDKDSSTYNAGSLSNNRGASPTPCNRPSPPMRDPLSIGQRPHSSQSGFRQSAITSTNAVSRLSRSTSGSICVSNPQSPTSPHSVLRTESSTSISAHSNPNLVGRHVTTKLTTTNRQNVSKTTKLSQATLLQEPDRQMYGQTRPAGALDYPYTNKPMSEVRPQQQAYVQRVEEPVKLQVNLALQLFRFIPASIQYTTRVQFIGK
jgi:hypothetical protein